MTGRRPRGRCERGAIASSAEVPPQHLWLDTFSPPNHDTNVCDDGDHFSGGGGMHGKLGELQCLLPAAVASYLACKLFIV